MNLNSNKNRFFIDISYKGTKFHGWQKQKNEITIQQSIEDVLKLLFGEEMSIYGSGRTDAGVHAKQQIAHVDLPQKTDLKLLKSKLNKLLPKDISINNIKKVNQNAHARFDAVERTYEYVISHKKDPFYYDYSLLFSRKLDLQKMNDASKILLKKENFKSFCKSKSNVNNYKCKVTKALWKQKDHLIIFTITSNRFLRGMVRAIVGTIFEVGLGNIDLKSFEEIIDFMDRNKAKNISSKGLILKEIKFD
ncbi:MAG: tRNA pseudouridine(38-40) synthase TruA [Bacteroidetes bacterium]|nr:tRNA pseudouridine(38-40) synthase TruA [Bacteroidota bacterium]